MSDGQMNYVGQTEFCLSLNCHREVVWNFPFISAERPTHDHSVQL